MNGILPPIQKKVNQKVEQKTKIAQKVQVPEKIRPRSVRQNNLKRPVINNALKQESPLPASGNNVPAFQEWCSTMGGSYQEKEAMFNPDSYTSYSEYLKIMTKFFNSDNPAPFISARSWVMLNRETGQVMYAKQENERRQVASLTKIMTSTVVLELLQKYKLNSEKMMVEILYLNTTGVIGGTTADLITGDRVSVKELLYGMMLPSGNDAAQSLGVYFGNFA